MFVGGIFQAMEEAEVDVEEVIHGNWGFIEYEFFICSVCGEEYFNDCNSTKEAKQKLKDGMAYHYCPNCGATMDGGSK